MWLVAFWPDLDRHGLVADDPCPGSSAYDVEHIAQMAGPELDTWGPGGRENGGTVTGQGRLGAAALAAACLILNACAGSPALSFDDEFNGAKGAPPPANWGYDIGSRGWGNHELETYTSSRANSYLDGSGHLVIKAIREPDGTWTSARLVTSGHFSQAYGTFTARIKFPGGAGMWPAFWLLGDNGEAGGEIDIAEEYGNPAWGDSSASVYSQNDTTERATGDTHAGTGWHVWTMSWSPTSIKFYKDGKLLLIGQTVSRAGLEVGCI